MIFKTQKYFFFCKNTVFCSINLPIEMNKIKFQRSTLKTSSNSPSKTTELLTYWQVCLAAPKFPIAILHFICRL